MRHDGPFMSTPEQIGSAVFFYIFLPALIVMGIWAVVKDINRDRDIDVQVEAENNMIKVQVWLLTVHYFRDRDSHFNDMRELMQEKRAHRGE